MAGAPRETFWVVLLDVKNRILGDTKVSEGTLSSAVVHPREVFRPAVEESAAAVILVHNHPSGDPTPSAEDVANAFLFLASDEAAFITGSTISVNGGQYLA